MGLFDDYNGGLITYWKTKTAITSLVGAGDNCRIWPDQARQKSSEPYIVFDRASGESAQHLGGVSGARKTVLHVYCYGATSGAADALAEAVRTSTANFRGSMSGTTVMWVECTDAPDSGCDQAQDGKDSHRYWVRVILRISHVEALGV